MSHSAHRYGTREELQNDWVVFVRPCKQFDDVDSQSRAKTIQKTEALADIVYRQDPVNIGRTKPGSVSQGLTYEEVMSVKAMNGFMSVFTGKTDMAEVLAELKNADAGLSVVVSGAIDDVFEVCSEVGLQPHTALCSLGIWGKTELLPSEDHLKIITLCGHSMVSVAMIDHCVEEIRQGRMTYETAAKKLAKPCPCGIFNIPRTIEILKTLIDR